MSYFNIDHESKLRFVNRFDKDELDDTLIRQTPLHEFILQLKKKSLFENYLKEINMTNNEFDILCKDLKKNRHLF